MSFDYDRLKELADNAPPGPWEVEEFEEHYANCPPNTKFYLSSDDTQGIAACEVSDRYYDQAKNNFELMALTPDTARELLHLRDVVKEQIDHLRALVMALELVGQLGAAGPVQDIADTLTELIKQEDTP